ncbi:NosL family protein [hot springs metagenome]
MGQKKCKCMSMDHSQHGSHMGHQMPMQEDTKAYASCKYCGMDREKFAHTAMTITYDDGTVVGTCSIHCAAIDLAVNMGKSVKLIEVGDYNTKKQIDAQKAFWVIGGSKQGVMTKNPKWAFEKKEDAEAFIKANGGKLATFDEALKAAYSDMYDDTTMIRGKRTKAMEHKH